MVEKTGAYTGNIPGDQKIGTEKQELPTRSHISELPGDSIELAGSSNPDVIDGNDITLYKHNLKNNLGPMADIQNDNSISRVHGDVPNTDELGEVFQKCVNNRSIAWNHLDDACKARAHLAASQFIDRNYNCTKIFARVGERQTEEQFSSNPDNTDGNRFKVKGEKFDGEWKYHVAPLVFAVDESTGELDGYVVDPSINKDRPLKADEWIKEFWSQDFPIRFDVTHPDLSKPPTPKDTVTPREFSKDRFDESMPRMQQESISKKNQRVNKTGINKRNQSRPISLGYH
jgi:hypothetical protein